jgi:hypothetical protein
MMPIGIGKVGTRMCSMEAVKIRKDGTRINLGELAYWHVNPFKRLAWRIRQFKIRVYNHLKYGEPL